MKTDMTNTRQQKKLIPGLFDYIRTDIPIGEVVELLGYTITDRTRGRGKIPCSGHNDTHPSMIIDEQKNSCWCPVCNIGGSPLDFVLIHNGITDTRHSTGAEKYQAALQIADFFPELYATDTVYTGQNQIDELTPPDISNKTLEVFGLKKNPYYIQAFTKGDSNHKSRIEIIINRIDATEMILKAIEVYIDKQKHFKESLLSMFPDVSEQDKDYMTKKIDGNINLAKYWKMEFVEYSDKLISQKDRDILNKPLQVEERGEEYEPERVT